MADKLILTVNVRCLESVSVKGGSREIVMVPFTGSAEGPFFSGAVIGTGTDTQFIGEDGVCRLSARYMLEGTDITGKRCRVFIENETRGDGRLRPTIVTDSEALAVYESAKLYSGIEPCADGVTIRIYEEQTNE